MKELSTLLLLCLSAAYAQAQGVSGLLGHWNMDSTVNDVSGSGHNGHANNIVAAPGADGVAGHGYYFNGSNSFIGVPASPAFNVQKYTICSRVKVMGYYSGNCQFNTILTRGNMGTGVGNYFAAFFDNSNCTGFDSTTECFMTQAEFRPVASPGIFYTPAIVSNTWHNVVSTFNDTVYKTYVNGVLVNTATLTAASVPMGTSSDSISIGLSTMDVAAGYPYPFKGVIDDIRLYDRALTDSESVHYGDTCGRITSEPVSVHTAVGSTCSFTTTTNFMNPIYQWQQNTGSGFTNLVATLPYSGVTSNSLTITGVTTAFIGSQYRCIITNSWGCADTTNTDTLFSPVGVVEVMAMNDVTIIPNPAHNIISVQLTNNNGNGTVELINTIGQLVGKQAISSATTSMDISALPTGLYIAVVRVNGEVVVKKVEKL